MTPPLDRRSAVLLLLDSLLDYVPTPKSSAGQLAASGGAAVGTVVVCANCDGSGLVIGVRIQTGTKAQQTCRACEGSGTRRARKSENGTDPMLSTREKAVHMPLRGRGMDTHELDSELARLERSRRERSGERSSRDAYGWERERAAARKAGSYVELERALDWLREVAPGRAYRVWRFVYGVRSGWSDEVWWAFSDSVDLLEARLPARIRVPQAVERRLVDLLAEAAALDRPRVLNRDERIRRDRELGWSQAQLGVKYGVSQARVSQITATMGESR